MSKIIFHMNPNVDITRLEIEYEMDETLADLTSQLSVRNVERVEFVTDED